MLIYRYNVPRTKGEIGIATLKKRMLSPKESKCYICNAIFNNQSIELEHKIPIMIGGNIFDYSNLDLICYKCHKKKTSIDILIINSLRRLRIIEGRFSIDSLWSLERLEEFYKEVYPLIEQKKKFDDWSLLEKPEIIFLETNRKIKEVTKDGATNNI